jgi:hypothetical protein
MLFSRCLQMLSGTSSSAKTLWNMPLPCLLFLVYASGLTFFWIVYDQVAGREWTSIMTLSGVAHCFGLVLLCVQVYSNNSAAGISLRALMLDGLALTFRLSSTLFFFGYLPSDASGDYACQIADLCSLATIAYLARCLLVTHRESYQEADDSMSVGPVVIICLFLGVLLHGDMDDNLIADSSWLTGLFVSVVAVLPQYWLILNSSGQTHALTAHYIAASAVDRILSGVFMWHSSSWITCSSWVGTFQHAIVAILAAHLIHLMLLSDFAFYYLRAALNVRENSPSVQLVPPSGSPPIPGGTVHV